MHVRRRGRGSIKKESIVLGEEEGRGKQACDAVGGGMYKNERMSRELGRTNHGSESRFMRGRGERGRCSYRVLELRREEGRTDIWNERYPGELWGSAPPWVVDI